MESCRVLNPIKRYYPCFIILVSFDFLIIYTFLDIWFNSVKLPFLELPTMVPKEYILRNICMCRSYILKLIVPSIAKEKRGNKVKTSFILTIKDEVTHERTLMLVFLIIHETMISS